MPRIFYHCDEHDITFEAFTGDGNCPVCKREGKGRTAKRVDLLMDDFNEVRAMDRDEIAPTMMLNRFDKRQMDRIERMLEQLLNEHGIEVK